MCILRVCVLRVYTSALRKLWNQQAGFKPERLCAFCVCAFCVCIPLRCQSCGISRRDLNRNACVHFARVRFACVYLCAVKVVESEGGSKPERLCAFCVCAFCVCIPPRRESCGIRRRG